MLQTILKVNTKCSVGTKERGTFLVWVAQKPIQHELTLDLKF